jgi:hypothetical protein
MGFLTCPKVGTWARLFYFPSEGRHAEDFYTSEKIQRLRSASNPRTREPEASMLTTRPPKPSWYCGNFPASNSNKLNGRNLGNNRPCVMKYGIPLLQHVSEKQHFAYGMVVWAEEVYLQISVNYWRRSEKDGVNSGELGLWNCYFNTWILQTQNSELYQDRDRWRTLVNAVMNIRFPLNMGKFLD